MDVVAVIWISSAIGAGLFVAAGVLLGDVLRRGAGPRPEVAVQRAEEQRNAAEARLSELERVHAESQEVLARSRAELELEIDARKRLDVDTRASAERQARLEAEVARLRTTAERARELEADAAQLRTMATRARSLEAEVVRLRTAAAAQRASGADELADSQRKNRELALQVTRLEGERAELRRIAGASADKTLQAEARVVELDNRLRDVFATLELERERARQHESALAEARAAAATADRVRDEKARAEARWRAELDRSENARTASAEQIRALQIEVDELRAEVQARATQAAADLRAERVRSELLEAAAREASARATSLAEARDWERGSEEDAERQRSQLEAELRTAEASLREARAQVAALEPRVRDMDSLREENSALRVELAELERQRSLEPGIDLPTFQRRSAELSLMETALEQRTSELARQAQDNYELRERVVALEDALADKEQLARQVQELEARVFAAGATAVDPAGASAGVLVAEQLGRLDEVVTAVVRSEPGCQIAVLSDLQGLLIAGAGDKARHEELAAAASLTIHTAERMRDLLPISAPRTFSWVDDNRVAVRVRWVRTADEPLLLTTFGVDQEATSVRVELFSRTISRLISSANESVDS